MSADRGDWRQDPVRVRVIRVLARQALPVRASAYCRPYAEQWFSHIADDRHWRGSARARSATGWSALHA